ncbi:MULTISPECIES: ABC transporter permease [Bacillus]|uniref:ABC transporter permease n=1 Tax=Bacillus TaxID=1386 RepID=UPI00057BE009|nr:MULTISPECIES: ABC transporter permease [Bacillus]MCD2369605.1 ABC transporter permease [Bacillus sp. BS3(2021)]MCJ8230998.1 ABC transporter permease [Bacillus paralicheniformis]MCU4667145.1 ABC transporter permease [Bacillus paralicheniformis]MEC1825503.1 ABC transporter permease [Bacillus paralicheniformis]MED1147087.1 ABC transporter permease [Bacillus paralicheniformis]
MNKFWIVLFHTYFSKLKTKSFIISTVITLALVVLVTNLGSIISMFDDGGEGDKIAVIDRSNQLYDTFAQQVKALDTDEALEVEKADKPEKELEKDVRDENLEGILILDRDKKGVLKGTYKALEIADSTAVSTIEQALSQAKIAVGTAELNVPQEKLSELFTPVKVNSVALKEGAKTEEELQKATGLVYVVLFVIYFSVLTYASMIATEVATEKSSRVMEILISSVPPVQQMFAKLFGVALLGLTQIAALFLVGYLSLQSSQEKGGDAADMIKGFLDISGVPTATLVYAAIFLMLGYFLYATLAAFLGSVVSRIEDVQQMISPMILLVVAGFVIAMVGLSTPDSTFITVTSFIPFFAPMIMFLRVGVLDIPFWEAALGIGITALTIVILAVIGARVYKGGVLMYTSGGGLKNIKQALRLSKDR